MEDRIALLALALILIVFFLWRVGKERREVRNRGVNEAPLVSALRALGYLLSRTIAYGAVLYLFASAYFYVAFRATCGLDLRTLQAYESRSLIVHVAEALVWPIYRDDGPPCR
jgi:hypothetical protein